MKSKQILNTLLYQSELSKTLDKMQISHTINKPWTMAQRKLTLQIFIKVKALINFLEMK